jgi:hypothetical protein
MAVDGGVAVVGGTVVGGIEIGTTVVGTIVVGATVVARVVVAVVVVVSLGHAGIAARAPAGVLNQPLAAPKPNINTVAAIAAAVCRMHDMVILLSGAGSLDAQRTHRDVNGLFGQVLGRHQDEDHSVPACGNAVTSFFVLRVIATARKPIQESAQQRPGFAPSVERSPVGQTYSTHDDVDPVEEEGDVIDVGASDPVDPPESPVVEALRIEERVAKLRSYASAARGRAEARRKLVDAGGQAPWVHVRAAQLHDESAVRLDDVADHTGRRRQV